MIAEKCATALAVSGQPYDAPYYTCVMLREADYFEGDKNVMGFFSLPGVKQAFSFLLPF